MVFCVVCGSIEYCLHSKRLVYVYKWNCEYTEIFMCTFLEAEEINMCMLLSLRNSPKSTITQIEGNKNKINKKKIYAISRSIVDGVNYRKASTKFSTILNMDGMNGEKKMYYLGSASICLSHVLRV